LLVPGPEESLWNMIKALFGSGLITGAVAKQKFNLF
jgi:hypothetical protein